MGPCRLSERLSMPSRNVSRLMVTLGVVRATSAASLCRSLFRSNKSGLTILGIMALGLPVGTGIGAASGFTLAVYLSERMILGDVTGPTCLSCGCG